MDGKFGGRRQAGVTAFVSTAVASLKLTPRGSKIGLANGYDGGALSAPRDDGR
jgi:hypothetical protein